MTPRSDEHVILVDPTDQKIGTMEKIEAHQKGALHRAFSVLIFNDKNEMLIQKRASDKYHSPGLWTNACCSHPRPGESLSDATHRRLNEEIGFDCELKPLFQFQYKSDFEDGMIEHEFDHVFTGIYNGEIELNPEEASEYRFVEMDKLLNEIAEHPNNFTSWFKLILERLPNHTFA